MVVAIRGDALIGLEKMELMRLALLRNFDRIVTGKARVAKFLPPRPEERIEAVPTEIAQRIRADVAANFFDGVRRGEQLLAGRRIDSVKARVGGRRSRDSHMNLARARLPEHRNDFPQRSSAHQRIFDEHDALAPQKLGDRIELELDPEV